MAIENGTQNVELAYLLDPAFQIEGLNGKPVIGGWLNVYEAGTDTKVITYQDFEGSRNPFNIKLGSDGRAVILADPSITYDVYAFDSYGNQIFSRLNVTPHLSGNISITGSDVVIYNADGTLDITQQSIQNNVRRYEINTKHKSFGVKEPLYFVEDSESATILGCRSQSGDYATTAYVESVISGKLDISSYSSQSGDFLTDKFEYDDNNHITAYNHSAFAGGGANYEAGDHIDITDNVISVTGLPTSSDVENAITSAITNIENKFEYNENNYITAYNNSAFAGKEYSAGDYVSIENDTISVTGLQPSGDYATKTDLSGKQDTLSAGDGITIVNNVISVTSQGGGIEQVSHDDTLSGNGNSEPLGLANAEDYVKQDDLTGYQPSGDYYSASNPSGFITSDDLTGYATTSLVSSVSSELYSAFSGISGDFVLVAGSGVELVDDPNAKTTTINVTAEGTPVTAIEQMIESATSGISAAISGSYTLVAGNGIQLTDDDNARTTTVSVSGDYLSATESANYYPMTGNPSGFLTAVPTGTMNESAFEYDTGNKISGYNGSAFAGGSEIPTAVSGYWQAASDTVCANSGVWGGSALPISAGPGIKLELVNDTLVASTDETVLYYGHISAGAAPTAYSLSEPISAFDSYRVYWLWNEGTNCACEVSEFYWDEDRPTMNNFTLFSVNRFSNANFSALGLFEIASNLKDITYTFSQQNNDTTNKNIKIKKIVGINRIAGGN